jgi:secreted protein with Ig-like and vWFA domain
MEEIAASEEPYSTFSLNISDASFRIAQAAMDKGERPDPAGVKVEQFYNAVDYGDPVPAAGEPVSCEIEQAAHPVIPGRNLVRVALKTAAAGRAATQPLHLTLLVDQSGSMTRADRRAAMDTAMASLGKLLTDKDLVNIVGFSRTSRLVADGMKGDEAGKGLAALVNQSASEGGTNLETAIDLAAQMAQRRMLAGAQNRIVLFTDGAANLGDADPQRLAAKVEQLRQQGIAFDIAGIAADGLNDELLGELARKGNGRYYVVGKGAEEDFAKQLAGAFRPAAENVKVQVRFNPDRVARYKLIGFEKDRLKTEDFRNDKVDAAELAAEEAGVAIYQIEPNPGGSGEIGEVSVRFRDTASGEMVERGWTIPHEAAAPAIDRATPSMQLATLAMFAAEKLKGGPLGEAIDFRQFAEAQANVKQFFGHDARVAEVLRMVDGLK